MFVSADEVGVLVEEGLAGQAGRQGQFVVQSLGRFNSCREQIRAQLHHEQLDRDAWNRRRFEQREEQRILDQARGDRAVFGDDPRDVGRPRLDGAQQPINFGVVSQDRQGRRRQIARIDVVAIEELQQDTAEHLAGGRDLGVPQAAGQQPPQAGRLRTQVNGAGQIVEACEALTELQAGHAEIRQQPRGHRMVWGHAVQRRGEEGRGPGWLIPPQQQEPIAVKRDRQFRGQTQRRLVARFGRCAASKTSERLGGKGEGFGEVRFQRGRALEVRQGLGQGVGPPMGLTEVELDERVPGLTRQRALEERDGLGRPPFLHRHAGHDVER